MKTLKLPAGIKDVASVLSIPQAGEDLQVNEHELLQPQRHLVGAI